MTPPCCPSRCQKRCAAQPGVGGWVASLRGQHTCCWYWLGKMCFCAKWTHATAEKQHNYYNKLCESGLRYVMQASRHAAHGGCGAAWGVNVCVRRLYCRPHCCSACGCSQHRHLPCCKQIPVAASCWLWVHELLADSSPLCLFPCRPAHTHPSCAQTHAPLVLPLGCLQCTACVHS